MIDRIDRETLKFICEKGLTFAQFCICLMIYHKDVAGIIKYTEEIGYLGNDLITQTNGELISEMDDLIEKGFVLNTELNNLNFYALDNFILTDKFTSGYFENHKRTNC